MIEALLVFGCMLTLLWVLRALDKAIWSGKPPKLGLLDLHRSDEAAPATPPTPGKGRRHA